MLIVTSAVLLNRRVVAMSLTTAISSAVAHLLRYVAWKQMVGNVMFLTQSQT